MEIDVVYSVGIRDIKNEVDVLLCFLDAGFHVWSGTDNTNAMAQDGFIEKREVFTRDLMVHRIKERFLSEDCNQNSALMKRIANGAFCATYSQSVHHNVL